MGVAPSGGARSAERVLALYEHLCRSSRATVSGAASACDLPVSTALRHLRTLESTGLAYRSADGLWAPGAKAIELAARVLSGDPLVALARPTMERLGEQVGESVYLAVRGRSGTAQYLDAVRGPHLLQYSGWVGQTIPLATSAAGRALTGRGLTGGYAVVDAGVEGDVTAIAAPVRAGGRSIASMSIVAPSARLDDAAVRRAGRQLVSATGELSATLSSGQTHEPDG
ncbi:IclR family transcriptional regulator [Georgenia sp. Z1491]|uniref:IclR family transcriptional regulator n=1 Tax=Georgenia sp. Z1491 TaxID=3416707 RepID=UPI003CF22FCF